MKPPENKAGPPENKAGPPEKVAGSPENEAAVVDDVADQFCEDFRAGNPVMSLITMILGIRLTKWANSFILGQFCKQFNWAD
ncbi:hypothetical protein Hanom_Chr10g00953921 [Helianthus anomalus]